MIKKALVVAVMLLAAMSARAQIGYKGQVALGSQRWNKQCRRVRQHRADRQLSFRTFDLGGRDYP